MSEQIAKQPHRWQPGQSGNPRGRKPGPQTLASALREEFPIEELRRAAREMMNSSNEDVRFKTLLHIFDRCHGKVADKLEVGGPGTLDDAIARAEELTDAQLEELVEIDRRKAAILGGHRVQDPKVLDGGVMLLPAPVARAVEEP